jgi:LEA14-like dessication related protein
MGHTGGSAMRKFASVLAGSALAVVAGCSMLGKAAFQQPVVNLRSVAVRGIGLSGGSLDVQLAVYNPNHYNLDASQLTYQVNLAGDSVRVASGTLTQQQTFRSNDTTVVVIPVDFTYSGIGAAGRALLNTGAVTYHVLGDVRVGTPVGNFTVPYSSVGRFTTSGLAR